MRRAMPSIAVLVAGLPLAAGCSAPPSGSAPSKNGIDPITFAIGKDNSGWLQGVITGWNQAGLVISSAVYEALTQQKEPEQALTEMAGQLTQIIRDG